MQPVCKDSITASRNSECLHWRSNGLSTLLQFWDYNYLTSVCGVLVDAEHTATTVREVKGVDGTNSVDVLQEVEAVERTDIVDMHLNKMDEVWIIDDKSTDEDTHRSWVNRW